MSLGGVWSDAYKDVFKETFEHEIQDKGDRLFRLFPKEMMSGNKTYFTKMGAKSATLKTIRLQKRETASPTYERRFLQQRLIEFAEAIDIEDLIKNIANPEFDIIQAALKEFGRQRDDLVFSALVGNTNVETNGTATPTGLSLKVAVDDHTYSSGSGSVGLTVSKIKKAEARLRENYGYDGTKRLILIAPYAQIMNLTQDDQFVSGDYRSKKPLEGPGIVRNGSGFLDIDMVAFERTGVDSNGDERAFLVTEDALKIGVYHPLKVEVFKDQTLMGSPNTIAMYESMGAVRMDELLVAEIACAAI
jgi:hypothetical protein